MGWVEERVASYGLIRCEYGPASRSGAASSANSQSSGRVAPLREPGPFTHRMRP